MRVRRVYMSYTTFTIACAKVCDRAQHEIRERTNTQTLTHKQQSENRRPVTMSHTIIRVTGTAGTTHYTKSIY